MTLRNVLHKYSLWNLPREGEGGGAGGGAGAGEGGGNEGAPTWHEPFQLNDESKKFIVDNKIGDPNALVKMASDFKAGQDPNAPWYTPLKLDADGVKFITDRNFPDAGALLKSAMEADRTVRQRNVIEKPDPEALDKWSGHELLGWKPKYEDYQLTDPKVPEDFVVSQELKEVIRKTAHENRVPLGAVQNVLQAAYDQMAKTVADARAAGAHDIEVTQESLKKDWQGDYDKFTDYARRAMLFGGVGVDDAGEIEKMMGAPRLVKLFARIGEKIGEGALPKMDGTIAGLPNTIAGTEAELNRLEQDPEWRKVFENPQNPKHKDYVAQRARLISHLSALNRKA